jgi:hypothetical protein
MFKQLKNAVIPSLLTLFNFSLQNSIVPDSWKESLVIPLPKINNPIELSDHRPISKIYIECKLLEKSVLEQMTEYTERNNLIDKFQSGFRRAHGTGTALLHIVEKIRYAINDKMLAIVVLLDNTKAFDSLDHELFYSKLYKLNFADSVVNWFKSYFYNRKQCVIGIDKKRSNWDYVNRGCGQGTILGPFIFTVYTYDIGGQIKYCEYHVYADDTQLYIFTYLHDFNHNVDLINEDLDRLVCVVYNKVEHNNYIWH